MPAPFQTWIGVNGTQDISFAYDPDNLPAAPGSQALTVGAENSDGSGGGQISGLPPPAIWWSPAPTHSRAAA
ncbi:MAG: hypothetical protein U0R72_11560 [Nakamurella multipartita]